MPPISKPYINTVACKAIECGYMSVSVCVCASADLTFVLSTNKTKQQCTIPQDVSCDRRIFIVIIIILFSTHFVSMFLPQSSVQTVPWRHSIFTHTTQLIDTWVKFNKMPLVCEEKYVRLFSLQSVPLLFQQFITNLQIQCVFLFFSFRSNDIIVNHSIRLSVHLMANRRVPVASEHTRQLLNYNNNNMRRDSVTKTILPWQ